jgi:addiction module HigA family antidote
MLDAAKRLACGETQVQITLRWGEVEWRAAPQSIEGRLLDGTPFTILGVGRGPLILWLSGETLSVVFPNLTGEERSILKRGDISSTEEALAVRGIHPGVVIREYLEAREWSVRELATRMNVEPREVQAVIDGKASLTPEMAKKLERTLHRPAQLWMNLQIRYDVTR